MCMVGEDRVIGLKFFRQVNVYSALHPNLNNRKVQCKILLGDSLINQ